MSNVLKNQDEAQEEKNLEIELYDRWMAEAQLLEPDYSSNYSNEAIDRQLNEIVENDHYTLKATY